MNGLRIGVLYTKYVTDYVWRYIDMYILHNELTFSVSIYAILGTRSYIKHFRILYTSLVYLNICKWHCLLSFLIWVGWTVLSRRTTDAWKRHSMPFVMVHTTFWVLLFVSLPFSTIECALLLSFIIDTVHRERERYTHTQRESQIYSVRLGVIESFFLYYFRHIFIFSGLQTHNIPYHPASAAMFLWIDMRAALPDNATYEDENKVWTPSFYI